MIWFLLFLLKVKNDEDEKVCTQKINNKTVIAITPNKWDCQRGLLIGRSELATVWFSDFAEEVPVEFDDYPSESSLESDLLF